MKYWILVTLVALGLSSCLKDVQSEAEKKYAENEIEIQNYISQSKLPFEKSASGLYYYFSTKNPNGAKPNVGDEISIHYKLFKMSGGVFDSTDRSKNIPFSYGYAVNSLILGMDEGIANMKVGERAVFLMNHYLAFGSQSDDLLPAYSAVGADVEVVRVRNEEQQIEDYIADKKLTVTEKTSTGLRFIQTLTTTNAQVMSGNTVSVKYTGKLLNDKEFDSGELAVKVGTNGVIKGFEEGISKMRIGEKAILIFPSALGYGTKGAGTSIRPYAPLLFEVEITK